MIKYIKYPLYKNSLFIVLSSLFNAGCGFFFWMQAGRLYSLEDVGLATALISSLALIILLSRLGFDVSIIRFFSQNSERNILGTSLIITTAAALLIGLAYIRLIEIFSPDLSVLKEPGYATVFLAAVIANSVAAVTGNAFIASRKASHYFYQNVLMALRVPLLVPLAFLGNMGIFGSVGISFLMAALWAIFLMDKVGLPLVMNVNRQLVSESMRFSMWNYISGMLANAPIQIIPIMVLNMLGEAEAAKYYIAFAIGNLVLIIPAALSTSLFVEGSHGEALKKNVIRAGSAAFFLQVPAVILIFLFGGEILGLIRVDYVDAFNLLRTFVISSFFVAVYSLFVPIQNVRMKVESIAMLNLLRFVLLLGLSYLMVSCYGINGTGYAWLGTYLVIDLVIAGVVKRERWI